MTHDEMAAELRAAGWHVRAPITPEPRTAKGKLAEQAAGIRYGCHCDLEDGEHPDVECVLDYGVPKDCNHASKRRNRETCSFWKRWPQEAPNA